MIRSLSIIGIASMLFILSGCSPATSFGNAPSNNVVNTTVPTSGSSQASANVVNSTSSTSSNADWSPVGNAVVAATNVPGSAGELLQLIDVKGKYTYDKEVGPYQGDNWIGAFQLRVVDAQGTVLSKLNLPVQEDAFSYSHFWRHFQFHFADYNGDGHPDFTLGQYGNSNGSLYEIFSITPSGIIQLSTSPTAQLFVANQTYSPLFQQVQSNGFTVTYYDNAQGKWYQQTFTWRQDKFVLTATKQVTKHQ